jgi:hypothetical protein
MSEQIQSYTRGRSTFYVRIAVRGEAKCKVYVDADYEGDCGEPAALFWSSCPSLDWLPMCYQCYMHARGKGEPTVDDFRKGYYK